MARRRSAVEKAKSTEGKIDRRYLLNACEVAELYSDSDDWFHTICNSFRCGYMQGVKATKAEMKKKTA